MSGHAMVRYRMIIGVVVLTAIGSASVAGAAGDDAGHEDGVAGHEIRGLPPGRQVELRSDLPEKPASGKLECALSRLETAFQERGLGDAMTFAESHGLETDGHRVKVTVRPTWGRTTDVIDLEGISRLGGVIRARSAHFLDISIPFDRLTELSECTGVAFVRRLMRSVSLRSESRRHDRPIVSEGVALTGAQLQHDAGYYGVGVRAAVIDGGFQNMTNAQAMGELPPVVYGLDLTGTGLETGSHHGTAVAENVFDMAPGAEMYLIKVSTVADLENAKDACVVNDIDVVNFSAGYYPQPGDGTGDACGVVEDAYANGILWVNAAGNNAENHNEGIFTDDNWNGWHEFASGDELLTLWIPSSTTLQVHLTWDGWPTSTEDYDFYLFDDLLNPVRWSDTRQFPTGAEPHEFIHFACVVPGYYHLAVWNYYTTAPHTYDIMTRDFSLLQNGEYCVPSGSLLAPSDAQHALAVGAMSRDNWYTGPAEPFSSQGPTNDGRTKPEITGPDRCASFTDPNWPGTSSAAPHVAGAAALVWSILPGLVTVDDMWDWLTENAIDMGAPGQDNIYGFGRLDIPPETPVEGLLYAVTSESGSVVLRWTVASLAGIEGFNVYRSTSSDGPFVVINDRAIEPVSPGAYEDATVWAGTPFWYELRAVLGDGTEDVVGAAAQVAVPGELALRLYRPIPNPISGSAEVRFDIPAHMGAIDLGVYDVRGRRIRSLTSGSVSQGPHVATWDCRDGSGSEVASGVYFLRLEAGKQVETCKVLVVR